MKNKSNSVEWVDFPEKIVYLYETLFDSDKEKLILHFFDLTSPQKLNSRKKTIENWLEGKTKKPNGFTLSHFKISELTYRNEQLFTINSFKKWSFEIFKKRVDDYMQQLQLTDTPNQVKYVYFFSTSEKKLSFFEIIYPDPENESVICLNSPTYSTNITYYGTINTHSSMSYINVHNDFDHMNFIFKNNVDFYTDKINVFGVAQAVDGFTREPKAFLVLVTSQKLSTIEEQRLAHKLNYSNLMIADDFSETCLLERDYFLENFSEKIRDLDRDTNHYNIHQQFEDDMYFDIVLQEYKSYIELLEQSLYHNDYPINHKRQSILFALEHMCRDKKENATIVYYLDSESISLLKAKNSIMDMQLKLVQEEKLTLSYFFIITDISIVTQRVIEQLYCLEKSGINVSLTMDTRTIYSKILIVEHKNFAIYKRKNEFDDNHVTRSANTIELLNYEVEEIQKESISLTDFITIHFPLDGQWFHYSYNSKQNQDSFHEIEFNIQNNTFTAKYQKGERKGRILHTDSYTLILLQHSVIRIHNIYLKENIFYVSVIGKEIGVHHKDVLLLGLFSKNKLHKKKVSYLLSHIQQKEDETFRLKVSNDFDSILSSFDVEV